MRALGGQPAQRRVPAGLPKVVWMLWLQGWERAPQIVGACRRTWESLNPGWRVIGLDRQSAGRLLSNAPLLSVPAGKQLRPETESDLIRLSLLQKFGGVWADATAYCLRGLDDWLPSALASGFFAFANPGPDRLLSNWFLAAEIDNPIIAAWASAAHEYWQHRAAYHDYFWAHQLFATCYATEAEFRQVWDRTPKISADGPHYFLPQQEKLRRPVTTDDRDLIERGRVPLVKLVHDIPFDGAAADSVLRFLCARAATLSPTPDNQQWLARPAHPRVFAYWSDRDRAHLTPMQTHWLEHFSDFRICGDDDVLPLLDRYFPEYRAVYDLLAIPAAKADIARLLLLYDRGGLYVDCHFGIRDANGVRALLGLLQRHEVVLIDRRLALGDRRPGEHFFINGVIVSRPGAALIHAIAERALANLAAHREIEYRDGWVAYHIGALSGPDVVTATALAPGSANREVRPEFAGRLAIIPEEEAPLERNRFRTYGGAGQHWFERQKSERLFRCPEPDPIPAPEADRIEARPSAAARPAPRPAPTGAARASGNADAPRDLIITGIPRAGTSLAAAIIDTAEDTLCLSEPDQARLEQAASDADAFVRGVAEMFRGLRQDILGGVPVMDRREPSGAALTNYFAGVGEGSRARVGEVRGLVRPGLTPNFLLGVKHNLPYIAALPALVRSGRFRLLAVVRDPVAVVMSWRSLDLPVSHGRFPALARFWPEMARLTTADVDLAEKQIRMHDLMCRRFAECSQRIAIVRYETIIRDPERLLAAAGVRAGRQRLANARLIRATTSASPGDDEVAANLAERVRRLVASGQLTGISRYYPEYASSCRGGTSRERPAKVGRRPG